MQLTDRQIRAAKPSEKKQKLNDGSGLYLEITPKGNKVFRFDFAIHGKRQTLTFGRYPELSLNEVRNLHAQAKQQIAQGINPAAVKQQAKQEAIAARENTFAYIATQWHSANLHRWKEQNARRILAYLENDVFPHIGKTPIDEIRANDIKRVLDAVCSRNAIATAEKIRQWMGVIFDYAAMLEITDRNPAHALKSYLPKPPSKHMDALPQERLQEFYTRLQYANTLRQNEIALLLIMLLFPRNHELRGGKWQEIDFQAATWTIPAERMKHERAKPKPPHKIPLADWAIELLQELYTLTGGTPYLFPSRVKHNGYISENTLGKIMKQMGYDGIATPHGFRSLASTVLNAQGFRREAIEAQLAHIDLDKIHTAYNRADYWSERVAFMQWYSDFLRRHYEAAKAQTA